MYLKIVCWYLHILLNYLIDIKVLRLCSLSLIVFHFYFCRKRWIYRIHTANIFIWFFIKDRRMIFHIMPLSITIRWTLLFRYLMLQRRTGHLLLETIGNASKNIVFVLMDFQIRFLPSLNRWWWLTLFRIVVVFNCLSLQRMLTIFTISFFLDMVWCIFILFALFDEFTVVTIFLRRTYHICTFSWFLSFLMFTFLAFCFFKLGDIEIRVVLTSFGRILSWSTFNLLNVRLQVVFRCLQVLLRLNFLNLILFLWSRSFCPFTQLLLHDQLWLVQYSCFEFKLIF